jgi:hypothetical protein
MRPAGADAAKFLAHTLADTGYAGRLITSTRRSGRTTPGSGATEELRGLPLAGPPGPASTPFRTVKPSLAGGQGQAGGRRAVTTLTTLPG